MRENIRDIFKIIKMTIIGLIVAILIYPFTHEFGHTLLSLINGAEVVEFKLLPIPYITCNIGGLTTNEIIAIGFAGNIIPLIINSIVDIITINIKIFEVTYFKMYFYFCCWLSMVLSAISAIFRIMEQDDIYNIISKFPDKRNICTIICIFLAIVIMIRLYKMDIKSQLINYINN